MINKTQLRKSNEAIKVVPMANKRVSELLRVELNKNLSILKNKIVSSQKLQITPMVAQISELSTSLASALSMTTWPLMISMNVSTLCCRNDPRRLSNSTQLLLKALENLKILIKQQKINEDKTLLIRQNKIVIKSRISQVWIHIHPLQINSKRTRVK